MFLQIATAVLVATTVITRPVLPRAQQSYSSIVVFGDSYTDNGNAYRLSNKTWPADPAYYEGMALRFLSIFLSGVYEVYCIVYRLEQGC